MRIELTPSAWKAEVLPLNHIRTSPDIQTILKLKKWSGRRDSNSRPSPWQGDALPLSHFRIFGRGRWIRTIESSANGFTVRPLWPLGKPSKLFWSWWRESNPQPADYKSAALPLSHTSILFPDLYIGGSYRARTCDPLLVRQMLSQLS